MLHPSEDFEFAGESGFNFFRVFIGQTEIDASFCFDGFFLNIIGEIVEHSFNLAIRVTGEEVFVGIRNGDDGYLFGFVQNSETPC